MTESTPIVAFDQHAASVMAAVLLPGERVPALQPLAPDLPTIGRFLERLGAPGHEDRHTAVLRDTEAECHGNECACGCAHESPHELAFAG